MSTIRAFARRWVRQHGMKVLFVDYIQLVKPDRREATRELEVSGMSASFKAIAKDFGITVVLLAQLNREGEGNKPKLSQLRESGGLEQDADIVALLHRSDRDDPALQVITAKHRNGPTGTTTLSFELETQRISVMTDEEIQAAMEKKPRSNFS